MTDFRGILVALGDIDPHHYHPGRTIAALQTVFLSERRLHGMQCTVLSNTLDGFDLSAVQLHREDGAGFDRRAVDMHCASAALAGVTTDMGAGQL